MMMTQEQETFLNGLGIPVRYRLGTGIYLTEEESRYCMEAITVRWRQDLKDFQNINDVELRRRYATVAAAHGLPNVPEGFRYTSGSSLELNVTTDHVKAERLGVEPR